MRRPLQGVEFIRYEINDYIFGVSSSKYAYILKEIDIQYVFEKFVQNRVPRSGRKIEILESTLSST